MNEYVPFQTPNLVWDGTIAIYLFLLGISSGAVQLAIAYRNSGVKMENQAKTGLFVVQLFLAHYQPLLAYCY